MNPCDYCQMKLRIQFDHNYMSHTSRYRSIKILRKREEITFEYTFECAVPYGLKSYYPGALFTPSRVISCGLGLVLILFVSLIHRRSWGTPRFRGNLLYARYVVFRPLASAHHGVPTLSHLFPKTHPHDVLMELDSVRHIHTHTRTAPRVLCVAYTCTPYNNVFVSIAKTAPSVLFYTYFALIHPSRPLTPPTTVYRTG